MDNDIIEVVSAASHEAWMNKKKENNIFTRLSETGEELMVPYEQLSEAAKDLDRVMIASVLKTLDSLGYRIVRP